MTKVKNNRFPSSLFAVYFVVLLLMSGIHTGLIVGMNKLGWSDIIQSIVPLLYWGSVAVGLTIVTRKKIRKTYEEPMHQLAYAARRVAEGDFSVYVPTIHTADKMDYLDVMLVNFNKMVEELGSIETLKTDFFSNVSHEFKTPLAVIYSNAQMLQKETSDATQQEYVLNILDATKRLSDLIQNMLKLNKLEKQTIHPVAENYDVCAQICACTVQFEENWEKKILNLKRNWRTVRLSAQIRGLWNLCGTICSRTPLSLPRMEGQFVFHRPEQKTESSFPWRIRAVE